MTSTEHRGSLLSKRIVLLLDLIIIVGLTVFGYVLRSPGLAPQSLFYDDAWVGVVRRFPLSDVWTVGFTTTGFTAGTKIWIGLVGFSELKLQIPMLFAGLLTPILLYILLRTRTNTVIAAAAALLVVVSATHVTYSVRVKQYTIEALFTTLLIWTLLIIIEKPDWPRRWFVLFGIGLLAVLTSFETGLVVGCAFVSAAIHEISVDRSRWRVACAWTGAMGTLSGLWFLVVIRPALSPDLSDYWSALYVDIDTGPGETVSSAWRLTGRMLEGFSTVPAPAMAIALVCALALTARRYPTLIPALAGPYVLLVALSALEMAPLGGGRTDMVLYPLFVVTLALGAHEAVRMVAAALVRLPEQWPGHAIAATGICATIAAAALSYSIAADAHRAEYPVEALSPLLSEVSHLRQPGDTIVVYYGATYHYALYTQTPVSPFSGPLPFGIDFGDPDVVSLPGRLADPAGYAPYVARAASRGDRIWFVVTHPCGCDVPVIEQQLSDKGLSVAEDWTGSRARISLWE